MANGNAWYKRLATSLVPGANAFFAPPAIKEPSKKDMLNPLAYVDPSRLLSGWNITPYNPSWLVTRKGLTVFDAMKRDEQVKAALKFKKDCVLSSGWEVVSPGDEEEDWEVTRFVRDALAFVPGGWNAVLTNILSALDYGYSCSERIYEQKDLGEWKGKLLLARAQSIKPHFIDFMVDEFGVLQGLQQQTVNLAAQPLPPAKFILYSHAPEFGNFYGVSDLEAAYRPYWVKENAYKWLAVTLERYGMPPLFALYDPNSYQGGMIDELKKVVKGIQNATLGVIPRASKEALEFWSQNLNKGSSELFLAALDRFDQHIARAILVPDLIGMSSNTGQTGSLARSSVNADSFLRVVTQLQNNVADVVMNGQVIPQLCDLNFPGLQSYPIFKFLPFTDDKRLEIIAAWAALAGASVVNKIEDDEVHIRKVLGFPENENPEVIEAPPPVVPGSVGADGKPISAKPEKPASKAEAAGETPLKKEQAPKAVAAKDLSEEMRTFAEENAAVWVEQEDGQRVAVAQEESRTHRHEQVLPVRGGGDYDEEDLPRQLSDLQAAIDGLGSAERAVEHRQAMQDRATKLLAAVESSVERNSTLDAVTQRFEEATARVAALLEESSAANSEALARVTEQLTEAQQADRETLQVTLTETAKQLATAQAEERVMAVERTEQQVKQLAEAQAELRASLDAMAEQVKRAARRPKAAKRNVKTGVWEFDYGTD